jgi:hypothetical protein
MRPLILDVHDEYSQEMRQLRDTELDMISGGYPCPTITVTPEGTRDDGTDNDPCGC